MGSIDSSYAAGDCGIPNLDSRIGDTTGGYTCLTDDDDCDGSNESDYGLTTDSGQWANELEYGTVYGMAKCSETSGNSSSGTWPESSKSDWLKTPSDAPGRYCWCQATGFTASGNSYKSGPQCTTTASSLWVFTEDDEYVEFQTYEDCLFVCPHYCLINAWFNANFRAGLFEAAGAVAVGLTWHDNGTTISGASFCTVGGTFLPPTPPSRTGYVFAGWHVKEKCGINNLDTSTNGRGTSYVGYTSLKNDSGNNTSKYGLTKGSGQWAVEFSYGVVYGMAKCSETSGSTGSRKWPESSKSDWLKTPSDTAGGYCWCQATGFTASGNSYTSGPQCTTDASSLWVYRNDEGVSDCPGNCPASCASYVRSTAAFRTALFGSVGQ